MCLRLIYTSTWAWCSLFSKLSCIILATTLVSSIDTTTASYSSSWRWTAFPASRVYTCHLPSGALLIELTSDERWTSRLPFPSKRSFYTIREKQTWLISDYNYNYTFGTRPGAKNSWMDTPASSRPGSRGSRKIQCLVLWYLIVLYRGQVSWGR